MPAGITLLASGRETEHRIPVEAWDDCRGVMNVTVPAVAAGKVAALLADGPFQSAEIFDADHGGSHMRDVTIEMREESPIRFSVQFRDPGLRGLMEKMG